MAPLVAVAVRGRPRAGYKCRVTAELALAGKRMGGGIVADADELRDAFAAGTLLRPAADQLNLVDLARALAMIGGVEAIEPSPGSVEIADLIGAPDHLVVVLADGMGMDLLELLPPRSLLRRQLATEIRTVFPSTTAVALTTLATGEWPAQHGITGWWTYLREIDGPATVVKFERRAGQKPLEDLGVAPETLLPSPSLMPQMSRDSRCFFPSAIADSTYSQYFSGGTAHEGYASLARGVDAVMARVRGASGPTYSYLYTPRVDAAAHEYGATDRHVTAELVALDQQVERLAAGLGPRSRMVVTADHGHLDAPTAKRHLIRSHSAVATGLRVPPAYDSRVMCFHLRDGDHDAWRSAFRERFHDVAYLLSVDEVEELELFGPGPLSPLTRERLGDYVSIVRVADAIGYRTSTSGDEVTSLLSQHSGLSPSEMRVPLIVV
ncbi:MAG: alkaline phosphatase family protein [Dehalococcoidia bacterium]